MLIWDRVNFRVGEIVRDKEALHNKKEDFNPQYYPLPPKNILELTSNLPSISTSKIGNKARMSVTT
jgi:hypothetical protein